MPGAACHRGNSIFSSRWRKNTRSTTATPIPHNGFGKWCFEPGCGIVPKRRAAGARHEVRDFDSVEDAVSAYLHNINTGRAYQRLREIRADLRRAGEKPSAIALADGLLFYSERREEYVNEVKRMILQYHKFQQTRET